MKDAQMSLVSVHPACECECGRLLVGADLIVRDARINASKTSFSLQKYGVS